MNDSPHEAGSLAHEHTDLRRALEVAEQALARLEAKRGEADDSPPPPPKWGGEPSGPRRRTYFTGSLRLHWDAFREALLEHMRHEELVLPSLVDRVETSHANAAEVKASLTPLIREHERLHNLFGDLRQASRSVGPVRPAMDDVVAAFLRHTEEEDTRLFPILFRHVGLAPADFPVLRRYTSDADLAHGLRVAVRESEDLALDEPTLGFFQRITALLRKSR